MMKAMENRERGSAGQDQGAAMKKGWEIKRLADVLELQNGYAFDSKGFNPTDGLPLIRIRSLKAGVETETRFNGEYGQKYVVKAGDLLIGMDGEFGCYEWKGELSLLNQRVCRLQGFSGELIPRFLFYGVNDYLKAIEDVTGYTTVKHISSKQILEIEFPLPPLAEQQRIVGLLDEAFEGLATAKANAEKNLQNARALFESALTTAMSGKLTKEWRKSHPDVETGSALLEQILAKRRRAWLKKGEYPEPVPSVTNDSQSIPASWTWSNLSQLKTFSLYGPRFSKDDYSQTGVLVLRTSDIDEHGKVNSDTAPKLKMTEEEFDKYQCMKGDLLITRTGSLGTLAVFDDDTRAIPGAYLIQFRLGFSEVIPWFLFAFFKSPAAQVRLTSGGTGAGIQNLNVPTLEAIQIPFPPLEEQREIVALLETIAKETQRLARLYERKLAALEALKKSLLHKAFTGAL